MITCYIRNSKIPCPVHGLVTEICDGSVHCGHLYWRLTHTYRKVFPGRNRWDLFAVETVDGYVAEEVVGAEVQPGILLGRNCGMNYGFNILRITHPEEELPNGSILPPEYTLVHPSLGYAVPDRYGTAPGSMDRAWGCLTFHQPGGPGSSPEPMPHDAWERELVSYHARLMPLEYRTVPPAERAEWAAASWAQWQAACAAEESADSTEQV